MSDIVDAAIDDFVRRRTANERTVAEVRAIALRHGWAIGTHGSLVRDIDLIAVPWVDGAATMADVVAAICEGIGYRDDGRSFVPQRGGRVCRLLLAPNAVSEQMRVNRGEMTGPVHPKGIWDPPAIDLSLIDPRTVKP